MATKLKELYRSKFERTVQVDEPKTEQRDGKDVTVISKVDKKNPVNLIIINPKMPNFIMPLNYLI